MFYPEILVFFKSPSLAFARFKSIGIDTDEYIIKKKLKKNGKKNGKKEKKEAKKKEAKKALFALAMTEGVGWSTNLNKTGRSPFACWGWVHENRNDRGHAFPRLCNL